MRNTRGKCKAKYYQQVFKCMQLNNVLSVVTGTYLGAGGSVRARGGHEGGGGGGRLVTGREMAILCACFFSDIVIP